jgi:hypothetical protein
MHPTLRSARLRRGAVVAAAGALALGLLPLATAGAVPADRVSYVSAGALAAGSRNADGTGTLTSLTDAGYRTFSLAVSRDGNTALLAVCHGAYVGSGATAGNPSQCTDDPNGTSYDATFGLVLVHRDSGGANTVRAKVLSTQWDANPVLTTTTGGQTSAWFMLDGVLYTYALTDTGTWNVTDASAAVKVANATAFQPIKDASTGSPLEVTTGLAVSADGAHAAVTYLQSGLVLGRVKAASIPAGTTEFENSFSRYRTSGGVITQQPTSSLLAFPADNHLLFGLAQFAANGTPGNIQAWHATGATTAEKTHVATLDGSYGLQQTSSGPWWLWKDNGTAADLYEVSDANLLTTTAPVQIASRADGSSTYDYVPSAATPPSLADVAVGADTLSVPAGHIALAFSARSVAYKGRPAYASSNYYWAPLPSRPYSTGTAAEVDKGTLQWNAGFGWLSGATSGAAAFGIGSKYYNGHTPVLYRNTQFRWIYPGDKLTAGPFSTSPTTITVVPTVVASVKAYGASRRVSGSITRVGGIAGLYRLSGRSWRYVASAAVTSKGAYNFGYRKLIRGTYKVQVAGSTAVGSWATGARIFKI